MKSAWDRIAADNGDKPKIEREPPQEGDICSDPKCSGRLEYMCTRDCFCLCPPPCKACCEPRLACNACGDVKESAENADV